MDSCDNKGYANAYNPKSPKQDEKYDEDDHVFDGDTTDSSLGLSLSPRGSLMSSLSALSNSSEALFSENSVCTPSSPGSAHSHHSYDSNLSSSSEASVKTVVRVNCTTIEAEICVNKNQQ